MSGKPSLRSIAAFYKGYRLCRVCDTPLEEGVNTHTSWLKGQQYICKACRAAYDFSRKARRNEVNRERKERLKWVRNQGAHAFANAYAEALTYQPKVEALPSYTMAFSAPATTLSTYWPATSVPPAGDHPPVETHDLIDTDAILKEPRVSWWQAWANFWIRVWG